MPIRETRTLKLTLSIRQHQIIDDAIKAATRDIAVARIRGDNVCKTNRNKNEPLKDNEAIAGKVSMSARPTAEQCLTMICGQWLSPPF